MPLRWVWPFLAVVPLVLGAVVLLPAPASAEVALPVHETDVATGVNPRAVAVHDASRQAFVVNSSGRLPSGSPLGTNGSVTVIDADTLEVSTTIPLGGHPDHVAVSQDRGLVFVGYEFQDRLVVIDVDNLEVVGDLAVGSIGTTGLAVDETADRLYAAVGNLTEIDMASLRVVARHRYELNPRVGTASTSLSVDPATGRVFLGDPFGNVIRVFDSRTDTFVRTVSTGDAFPVATEWLPGPEQLLVTAADGTLRVLDTDLTELGSTDLGLRSGATLSVTSRSTGATYVVLAWTARLATLDAARAVVGSQSVADGSQHFSANDAVLDDRTGRLLVTEGGANRVRVLQEAAPPRVATADLPLGVVGSDYEASVDILGPRPSRLQVSAGTLPPGLSLDEDTATISGTPTAEGTSTFSLRPSNEFGSGQDVELTIEVGRAPTLEVPEVPATAVGQSREVTVQVGGTSDVELTIEDPDTAPAGLSAFDADGTATWAPTAEGTHEVALVATNRFGTTRATLVLRAAVAPTIDTEQLPAAVTGQPYFATVDADGTAPLRHAVEDGMLPPGLRLDPATGALTGATERDGSWTFTVVVSNDVGTQRRQFTITSGTAPSILTTRLSPAVAGEAYRAPLEVAGTDPVTLEISSGELPEGLALDEAEPAIVGVPTGETTATFTLRVSNASGSAERELELDVGSRPAFEASTLPVAVAGEQYTATVPTTGTQPRSVRPAAGRLPVGISLAADGSLTGTTEEAGVFGLELVVENAFGRAVRTFELVVEPGALASLEVAANRAVVAPGDTVRLSSTGSDSFGNALGDLTDRTTFTSDEPSDVVVGRDVTAGVVGSRTITGTVGDVDGVVDVRVLEDRPPDPGPSPAPGPGPSPDPVLPPTPDRSGATGSDPTGPLPRAGAPSSTELLAPAAAALLAGVSILVGQRLRRTRRTT